MPLPIVSSVMTWRTLPFESNLLMKPLRPVVGEVLLISAGDRADDADLAAGMNLEVIGHIESGLRALPLAPLLLEIEADDPDGSKLLYRPERSGRAARLETVFRNIRPANTSGFSAPAVVENGRA